MAPDYLLIPSNQKMDSTIVFFWPKNLCGIILNKPGYVRTQKLLPMPRDNITTSMSHVNTFCEILNDLHGLMALNGHSGPPDCILILSETKMNPTMVFLMV